MKAREDRQIQDSAAQQADRTGVEANFRLRNGSGAYEIFARERRGGRLEAVCGDREAFPRARRETRVARSCSCLRDFFSCEGVRAAKCSSRIAAACWTVLCGLLFLAIASTE